MLGRFIRPLRESIKRRKTEQSCELRDNVFEMRKRLELRALFPSLPAFLFTPTLAGIDVQSQEYYGDTDDKPVWVETPMNPYQRSIKARWY